MQHLVLKSSQKNKVELRCSYPRELWVSGRELNLFSFMQSIAHVCILLERDSESITFIRFPKKFMPSLKLITSG